MSMYRKDIFPCNYFHSRVEDNEALKRVILPYVAQTLDNIKEPPDGWLTNNLKTSFTLMSIRLYPSNQVT